MVGDTHSFVIANNGELRRGAKDIVRIREYLEEAPETMITFKLRDVDDVFPSAVKSEHVDLLGSWNYSELVRTGRERVLVNPNHEDREMYPELVEECECGVIVSRGYNDLDRLDFETGHDDNCRSFDRLRLRARISERRYNMVIRLSNRGWNTREMAPRLGTSPSSIRHSISSWDVDLDGYRNEFRRKAGNTYHYLVHELGYEALFASNIYGYSVSQLQKLYRNM